MLGDWWTSTNELSDLLELLDSDGFIVLIAGLEPRCQEIAWALYLQLAEDLTRTAVALKQGRVASIPEIAQFFLNGGKLGMRDHLGEIEIAKLDDGRGVQIVRLEVFTRQ